MKQLNRFHAFFYVNDLQKSVHFYRDLLGFNLKQTNETSFTIDFYGHGVSFEYHATFQLPESLTCNKSDVDGRQYVPSNHWGINLSSNEEFEKVLTHVLSAGISFIVEPTEYNQNTANHQRLFFIKDPTGYLLEFRYMSREFRLPELEKWDQRSEGHKRERIESLFG